MSSKKPGQLQVYGISNCDKVRATLKWLEARKVPHTFHDFRKDTLSTRLLKSWLASAFAAQLVNKRSTSWRQLSTEEKKSVDENALKLILANPTLIKRPVITDGEDILAVGFSPQNLEDLI